jgi:hypothetical protein
LEGLVGPVVSPLAAPGAYTTGGVYYLSTFLNQSDANGLEPVILGIDTSGPVATVVQTIRNTLQMETVSYDAAQHRLVGVGLKVVGSAATRIIVLVDLLSGAMTEGPAIAGDYFILRGAEGALDVQSGALTALLAPLAVPPATDPIYHLVTVDVASGHTVAEPAAGALPDAWSLYYTRPPPLLPPPPPPPRSY